MRHYIQKFIILIIIFLSSLSGVFAAEPIKINELLFDNSDSIIYIKSTGKIDDSVTFTKGYLKDPDRIYLDINNSILTTPKKSYDAKYSVFNNIKISQFTLEPKTVRLVFEYNKNLDLSAFQVFKSNDSIFIKTNGKIVSSPKFKTIYSNSKTEDRTVFYKGAKFEESGIIQAVDLIQNENAPKNEITAELTTKTSTAAKTSSKYYIDSITKTKNGIIINGLGKLSLMPSFTLREPDRLIMDLDDTVVAAELRNKTFPIGEIQTHKSEEGNVGIDKRETIKIGQNSQNVARLVIQGENAKDYKGIISPDSKSLYITNRSNIITTKMSDNNANLTKSTYSSLKDLEVISLSFDDSTAFNVFEENSNLYLDINNLNVYQDGILDPVKRAIPDLQTTRLALDKLRITIPGVSSKNISVKTDSDNKEIRIYSKAAAIVQKPKKNPTSSYTPIVSVKKKQPEISNLFSVVIDAGHGGNDVGATRNNIYEKDITLKISKMVEKNLNKKNVKTYMVRDKDKTVSLAERCEFSNEKKPNLFVSIHVNSSTNDTSYGVETHWYKEDSKQYAEYVHREMQKKIKSWKTIDRGLFKSQFYVINHTEAPAILCEIGFISNKNEREEIIKTKRQEEIAEAIADGIYNYLKAKK